MFFFVVVVFVIVVDVFLICQKIRKCNGEWGGFGADNVTRCRSS